MEIELILNELSIESPAEDIETARYWMQSFLETVRFATKKTINRQIRTEIDINNTILADEYPLARWRNDDRVDRELRRWFLTLTTKYPAIEDFPELKDELSLKEFKCEGKNAGGLGYAFLMEGLAISFQSDYKWERNLINLSFEALGDDLEITHRDVQVYHASQPKHIHELNAWIDTRIALEIKDGDDLLAQKTLLFPSLIFSERIENEIRSIKDNSSFLGKLIFNFKLLHEKGVYLDHPYSSNIENTKRNIRELRIQHRGDPYRALYSFNSDRLPLLLLFGNKKGDDRWYNKNVPIAEALIDKLIQ